MGSDELDGGHQFDWYWNVFLSNARNTCLTVVSKGFFLTDMIKVLVNFTGTFVYKLGVCLLDTSMKDTVSDILSFYLPPQWRLLVFATHFACRNPVESDEILLYSRAWKLNAGMEESRRISHMDSSAICISDTHEGVQIIVWRSCSLWIIWGAQFQTTMFYNAAYYPSKIVKKEQIPYRSGEANVLTAVHGYWVAHWNQLVMGFEAYLSRNMSFFNGIIGRKTLFGLKQPIIARCGLCTPLEKRLRRKHFTTLRSIS